MSSRAVGVVVAVLLVVGAAGCAWHRSDGDGTVTPTGRTTDESVTTPDGRTRTYHVHVPDTLPPGAVPLLVALHGGTGSGPQFERTSGFDGIADAQGFIVVYPDGVGTKVLPLSLIHI